MTRDQHLADFTVYGLHVLLAKAKAKEKEEPMSTRTPSKRDRWAAAKLRNLLSRNASKADTMQGVLDAPTVAAIIHAIRRLERRRA